MNAVAPLQMATGLLHLLSDVAILYGEAARERIMTVIEQDIASDAESIWLSAQQILCAYYSPSRTPDFVQPPEFSDVLSRWVRGSVTGPVLIPAPSADFQISMTAFRTLWGYNLSETLMDNIITGIQAGVAFNDAWYTALVNHLQSTMSD